MEQQIHKALILFDRYDAVNRADLSIIGVGMKTITYLVASDVDCSSGSGNGPAYVDGPVQVIGRDIYGLDRDGDGIGCE